MRINIENDMQLEISQIIIIFCTRKMESESKMHVNMLFFCHVFQWYSRNRATYIYIYIILLYTIVRLL